MSNFFQKALGDVDNLEQELLGPDYNYTKQIKTPDELGMSAKGSISTLTKDIGGLIGYVNVLVTGGGTAQKTKGPLGDRFFLKTGAKCKDTASGELVTRSIYVDNIPDGTIPFITSALGGAKLTTFEGLVPGVMGNLAQINPMKMFQAFMTGSTPDCKSITLNTQDVNNLSKQETAYLTLEDIKSVESFETLSSPSPSSSSSSSSAKLNKLNYSKLPDNHFIKLYYGTLGLFGLYLFILLFKRQIK